MKQITGSKSLNHKEGEDRFRPWNLFLSLFFSLKIFSFFSFFLMWTIFKVFVEFLTILLLFYILVFWL